MSVSLLKSEKCEYCGKRDESVSCHSGVMECQPCWYDRKMNRPAARHWAKAAAEYTSNVDTWDFTKYVPAVLTVSPYANDLQEMMEDHNLTQRDLFSISILVAASLRDVSRDMIEGKIKHLAFGL